MSKENIFVCYYKDIIEQPNGQFRLSFRSGKRAFTFFPSKTLRYLVINSYSQKLSTSTIVQLTTCERIDNTLQTTEKEMRAITTCNTFNSDCRCDNVNNNFIVNVHCQNKMCYGKLSVHKKFFSLSKKNDYQCPQCASICRVHKILFREQTNPFLLTCKHDV